MTKRDLEDLKNFAIPPARAEARRAALEAALLEFDAVRAQEKILDSSAQGPSVAVRPKRTEKQPRSFLMTLSRRQNMAIAASLVAMVVAAPIAFRHARDLQPPEIVATANVRGQADVEEKQVLQSKKLPPAEAASKPDAAYAPQRADIDVRSPKEEAKIEDQKPAPKPALRSRDALLAGESALTGRMSAGINSIDAAPPPPPAQPMAMGQGFYVDETVSDGRRVENEYRDKDVFNAPEINPIKQVASEPVSTFSFDVDTASYSFMRRALNAGHLPPKESVRVEEMINYFPYDYPAPDSADVPFKPTVTVIPAPWKPSDKLVHIAIKGYDLKSAERPRANLVFLLDISGSMESDDRLPLVKNALHLLVDQLKPDDTVGIVTYASGSGIALEPTKISDKAKILAAIDKLQAGGSTDGADGIADAYRLAEANFDKKSVNRIILATDGDFNVGLTDRDQLKSYIERKRSTGIFLSILGVGQGNHNDALMQALAQNGNGTAAYVDTLNEARKVLVDEASSTLFTIAKDVKAQVEWNPARVSQYRLIGYETRALKREDFNNDRIDAGDVGSGHTVTAIYEVTPTGASGAADEMRYAPAQSSSATGRGDKSSDSHPTELGFLKLRFKKPGDDASQLISLPIGDAQSPSDIKDAPTDVRFSVAVAAFGDLVRGSPFVEGYGYDDVIGLAQSARGDDPFGYRAEFLNLARLAKSARP